MRKYLLLTTCGAALSALAAFGAASPALAQAEQQKHNTPTAEQSTGNSSAQNERRETTGKSTGALQEKRATDEGNKAGSMNEERKGEAAKPGNQERQTTGDAAKPNTTNQGQAAQENGEPKKANRNETREKGTSAGNQTQGAQGQKTNNEAQGAQEGKTNNEAAKGAQQTTGHEARQGKQLDEHQASQFRDRLQKEAHVTQTNVNFNARVGVNVPGSVHLETLPTDIVAEYPQFRGYDFVMIHDQIVIVDPSSREVVEVVGGPVTGRAAAVNPCSTTQ